MTIADSAERRLVRHLGLDRYRRADIIGLRNPPRPAGASGSRDWALVRLARPGQARMSAEALKSAMRG